MACAAPQTTRTVTACAHPASSPVFPASLHPHTCVFRPLFPAHPVSLPLCNMRFPPMCLPPIVFFPGPQLPFLLSLSVLHRGHGFPPRSPALHPGRDHRAPHLFSQHAVAALLFGISVEACCFGLYHVRSAQFAEGEECDKVRRRHVGAHGGAWSPCRSLVAGDCLGCLRLSQIDWKAFARRESEHNGASGAPALRVWHPCARRYAVQSAPCASDLQLAGR